MASLAKTKRRLYGLSFESEVYDGVDMRYAIAYQSKWVTCTFVGVDFRMSNFTGAKFYSCKFKKCNFSQANFSSGGFVKCVFTNCSFEMASLPTLVNGTEFSGCLMQYASLYDIIVHNSAFLDCNMHGADLRFSQAKGVRFDGSDLWGAAVNISCQFFDQAFDLEQVRIFLSIAGRKLAALTADPKHEEMRVKLSGFCDVQWKVVERLMRDADEHDKPT